MYDSYYSGYGYTTPSYYSYTTPRSSSTSVLGVLAGLGAAFWLITIALGVLTAVGLWKVFKKAGHEGWESLIAGHNIYLELEMSGIKGYWFFLLYVPIANIVITIWKNIELAKSFGKGVGFGIGITFLPYIFIPMLGLGSSQYMGPAYHENNYAPAQNNYNSNINNNSVNQENTASTQNNTQSNDQNNDQNKNS